MKKLTLLIAFIGLSAMTYAQDFGKTLISGSVSVHSSKSESGGKSESSSFNFIPKVGWFLSPRIAVGGLAGYFISSSESSNPSQDFVDESKYNSFSVGPFVRVYQPLGGQFAFFAEGSVLYAQGKGTGSNSYDTEYTGRTKGTSLNLSPGFVFFPSKQIGLELTFGRLAYSNTESEQEGSDTTYKTNDFFAGVGLSNTSVGISFYLGRAAGE